jgi:hypothetical protein
MPQDDRGAKVLASLARALIVMAALAPLSSAWERIKPHPGGGVWQFAAVGNRKLILTAAGLHFRDPHQPAWTLLELPCRGRVDELHVFGNAVLANSYQGEPCLSRDGGNTWKAVASGPVRTKPGQATLGMVRHFGVHGLYVMAPDPDFVLFRSPDTGRTWKRLTDFDPFYMVDAGPDFLVSTYDVGVCRMDPATGKLTSAASGLKTAPAQPFYLMGKAPGVLLATTGEVGTGVYRYVRASNRWESLLADYGQFLPVLANEGSRVFMYVSSAPDSLSLWMSPDGGGTWQRQPADSGTPPPSLWVEGDTLVYGSWNRSLMRRHWSSRFEAAWDQGIYAITPQEIRLHGKVLYISAEGFQGFRRTRDRGATWETLEGEAYEILHIAGDQVYLSGPGYLDRIQPAGPGRERLSFPPMDAFHIYRLVDAGDRLYAYSGFSTGPGEFFPLLFSASKSGRPVWGDNLAIPFIGLTSLAGRGETLAVTLRDTLAYSKDAAKTWTRLARQPFQASRGEYQVHWEGNSWTLSDGIGLYRAADPAGPWNRVRTPLDTVWGYRLSGRRMLVYGMDESHLSSDGGLTWRSVPFPIPQESLWDVALSDSLVCVTSYSHTHCQELEPLPVGASPRWNRMPRVRPTWVRREGGMAIRNARSSGANGFHGLDGRVLGPQAR